MNFFRAISPLLSAVLVLVSCGHDAKRDNPLDPALTPPVELSVAVDDTARTVSLTWTPYEGEIQFAEYRIVRQQSGLTAVDTLVTFTAVDSTSFLDAALGSEATYIYRVLVMNLGDLEVASLPGIAELANLPPVQIQRLEFNSATASAELRWSSYAGGDFAGYRVVRTVGEDARTLAEISVRSDTVHVDLGLRGNTDYSYAIVVLTDHDDELPSRSQSGSVHSLVGNPWPIDLGKGSRGVRRPDFVRLYVEEAGRLTAQIAGARFHRLTFFNADGSEAQTRDSFSVTSRGGVFPPESTTTALKSDGRRFVASVQGESRRPPILAFITELDAEGAPVWVDYELFTEGFPEPLGPEATVAPSISLWELGGTSSWNRVGVSMPSGLVSADDLSDGFSDSWQLAADHSPVSGGVKFSSFSGLDLELLGQLDLEESGDFRVEVGVENVTFGRLGVQIGDETESSVRYRLSLNTESREIQLDRFHRVDGEDDHEVLSTPFPVAGLWPYELALEILDGRVTSSISTPITWGSDLRSDNGNWSAMAALEGGFALTGGNQRFDLSEKGELVHESSTFIPTSEMRVWQLEGQGPQFIGLCRPLDHRVVFDEVSRAGNGRLQWPDPGTGATTIGEAIGDGEGELHFPISFDVGPDGRIYVLDAANSRIQVFDSEGNYITQWGSRGSEPGQFDFGIDRGGFFEESWSLTGSVAVDNDGFIYVADTRNERIQKFAQQPSPVLQRIIRADDRLSACRWAIIAACDGQLTLSHLPERGLQVFDRSTQTRSRGRSLHRSRCGSLAIENGDESRSGRIWRTNNAVERGRKEPQSLIQSPATPITSAPTPMRTLTRMP